MLRYEKYKRGTPVEITEIFGNKEEQKTIGYYWMNDATNKRIVLMSTLPPLKLSGRYLEKRFCNYDMIKNVRKLEKNGRKKD